MYPSVYNVGKFVSAKDFSAQRLSAAGWVHYPHVRQAILYGGNPSFIPPLHIEVCVTYKCNFNCSWCNCALSRRKYDLLHDTINKNELTLIIKKCVDHQIGIQWTGGEPLINQDFISIFADPITTKLSHCLFTNGSLISSEIANKLMQSNLKFIRISLNASSPSVHQLFHGLKSIDLSYKALEGIKNLCLSHSRHLNSPKVGISIVLDSRNINDFESTLNYIYSLVKDYPRGLDFIVIRAINDDFKGTLFIKDQSFAKQYNDIKNHIIIKKLIELGIEIAFPDENKIPYIEGDISFGCSLFQEISPNGDLFLCSDQYGNKDYCIGNIFKSDFEEIWNSQQRKNTIRQNTDCFRCGKCPHHSRGFYFNSIINQAREMIKSGNSSILLEWIDSLQKCIPDYGHSFFI